jgi:hypothetical protein
MEANNNEAAEHLVEAKDAFIEIEEDHYYLHKLFVI